MGDLLDGPVATFLDMATRCRHCGRERTLEELKRIPITVEREMAEDREDGWDVFTSTIALLQHCTGCEGLTVSTYVSVDGPPGGEEDSRPTVVYPAERDLSDLPERVALRYREMLELQFAPDAFAVRAGKLLEAVCADHGIKGTLDERLDKLVTDGHLPEQLVKQSHLVRQYRNLGGHDSEIEPQEADVPLIRGFVEALLYNLYWGPAELKRANDALKKRRDTAATTT